MSDDDAAAIGRRLAMLEEAVGGPAVVATAVERFLASVDGTVAEVIAADGDQRARTAHGLKGSAAALGAAGLAAAAGEVEADPDSLDPDALRARVASARVTFEAYVAATKR